MEHLFCPECGFKNELKNKFCPGCGNKLNINTEEFVNLSNDKEDDNPIAETKVETTTNRVLMPDGTIYEGELKDGLANGFGKFIYNRYVKYRGLWIKRWGTNEQFYNRIEGYLSNGKYEGSVKLFNDDVLVFDGCLEYELKEGYGKEYYVEGLIRYEGEFHHGVYHGKGEYYQSDYPHKIKYKGEFYNSRFSGKGIKYINNDGDYFEGRFLCGEFQVGKKVLNHRIVYEGEWDRERYHGKGIQLCTGNFVQI